MHDFNRKYYYLSHLTATPTITVTNCNSHFRVLGGISIFNVATDFSFYLFRL